MFEVRQIISVFSKMRLERKSLGTTALMPSGAMKSAKLLRRNSARIWQY